MNAGRLLRGLAWIGIACGGPIACFTEVGNPGEEPAMAASVRVDYAAPDSGEGPDSVTFSEFRLRFLGAAYRDADSAERALWTARQGGDLDFLKEDALPRAALDNAPVLTMAIRLGASPGAAFIRGTYAHGGAARRFRFEFPDTLAFSLRYDSAALEAWRAGGQYDCRFVFFARRWLALPGLDTAAVFPDGTGQSVAVFDAGHNPDLHRALLQNFFHAFNGPRDYAGKKAKNP